MGKKYTSAEKINGEMDVRLLSDKAQQAYNNTDPCRVWKYTDGKDVAYALDICGDRREGLTLQEVEDYLEAFAEEEEGK